MLLTGLSSISANYSSSRGGPISLINFIVSTVASLTGLILSNLQWFKTCKISSLKGIISSLTIAVREYIASIATFLVLQSLQAIN